MCQGPEKKPEKKIGDSDTMTILNQLGEYGPVFFGIGFVAPLIAQSMDAAALSAPLGLSNIALGLIVGVSMGLVARLRGTWV